MKTVELEHEGLKRAYALTIAAKEIDARVDQEVKRIAPTVRMPGFRPGKVPPNLVRKMHGEALMRDALSVAVQDSVQQLLSEKKLRPAMQPEVELDQSYAPGKDAEVQVRLEALPDVPKPKIDGLKLERLTVEADDASIDAQLAAVGELAEELEGRAQEPQGGDRRYGRDRLCRQRSTESPFDGGTGEDMSVELGSGSLIPGFEDGLVGVKAGDKRDVAVTFPADYQAANLKGKPANFAITVKAVKTAGEAKIDNDFAKALGLNDLDQLKGLLRDQQQEELNRLTRTHMKRRLLDQLASDHHFPVPVSMVEAEFQNIMQQLRHEASHEADSAAALKEIEGDAEEYRGIAERRVRLGLLLSEIGQANGIEVTQAEMNRLVGQAASQYQPKDRERFIQYIQQEPMAAAQLRAPLYEDKVVDFLFSRAEITERAVSRAEIEADLESEEGHVHGPGCGHDHPSGQAGEGEESRGQQRRSAAKASGQSRGEAVRACQGSGQASCESGQAQARRAGEEGGDQGCSGQGGPAKLAAKAAAAKAAPAKAAPSQTFARRKAT